MNDKSRSNRIVSARKGAPVKGSATPGGCARRGPMNCTGDARSLNTGSVSTLSRPACTSIVAWPIQVMAGAACGACA